MVNGCVYGGKQTVNAEPSRDRPLGNAVLVRVDVAVLPAQAVVVVDEVQGYRDGEGEGVS